MVFESFAINFLWESHLSISLWYNYVDKFVVSQPSYLHALSSSLIQLTVIIFSLYKTYTTNVFIQLKYLSAIMPHHSKLPSLAQTHAWLTCITNIPPFTCGFMSSLALKGLLSACNSMIDTTKMPTRHHKFFYTASLKNSIHDFSSYLQSFLCFLLKVIK